MMNTSLAKISKLIVFIGIYLYFSAWVYIHFFYGYFGISPAELNIDYYSYLVNSFNVLASTNFLIVFIVFAGLAALRLGFLFIIVHFQDRYPICRKLSDLIYVKTALVLMTALIKRFNLYMTILFLVLLFPWLFYVSRMAAWKDYTNERLNRGILKSVQFVFRKESDMQKPVEVLDTAGQSVMDLFSDLCVLKTDSTRILRLLGESDVYYIVINQLPVDPKVGALPIGFIYFIDKKDVLLAKITLSSF